MNNFNGRCTPVGVTSRLGLFGLSCGQNIEETARTMLVLTYVYRILQTRAQYRVSVDFRNRAHWPSL
jgi:hypothetical protein